MCGDGEQCSIVISLVLVIKEIRMPLLFLFNLPFPFTNKINMFTHL